jgi:cytochrome P460
MAIHENAKQRISLSGAEKMKIIVLVTGVIVTFSLYGWAKPDYKVEYPNGYRNWTHVMSYLIGPQSPAYEKNGGLHHFYANEKALEGYRTGNFPDGSVLVDERNKAQENEGKTQGGDLIGIGVMVKDSRRYADTGGWGFEVFVGDNRANGLLNAQGRAMCYNCHVKQKDNDYVFSKLRN